MTLSRREFLAASAAILVARNTRAESSQALASRDAAAPPVWRQFKGDARRTGRSRLTGPLDPQPRWDTNGNPSIQSPMSVGSDGTIYLAGDTGVMYAYDPAGNMKWSRQPSDRYVTAGTAILHDGSILLVSESGLVVCYTRAGAPRWTFDLQEYSGPSSSPLIASDGTIYIGNYFTGMHALRPDGTQKWVYPQTVSGPPAEGLDGTIYFPSEYRLVALSPDGELQWSHASRVSYGIGSAPAVGDDGVIYVTGVLGQLLAVNPDGTRKWLVGVQGFASDVPCSPAIGVDGVIYYGSSYTYFNAVYPDGSTKWSRLTIENDSYSAPTIDADGTIYFGAATGKVHAFSPDGEQIWERVFNNGDRFYYVRSEPVVMRGTRLLVGAYDGVFVVSD